MGKPKQNNVHTITGTIEKQDTITDTRLEIEKQNAKAVAHPVPLNRFHEAVAVVADLCFAGNWDDLEGDYRARIVQEMAIALGFSHRYVHGDILKAGKHFMMIPTETEQSMKDNKRERKQCLADLVGNYSEFKNEAKIQRLVSIQVDAFGSPADEVEAAIRARIDAGELDINSFII